MRVDAVTLESAETLVSMDELVSEVMLLWLVALAETVELDSTEVLVSVDLFTSEVTSLVMFVNVVFPLEVALGITQVPLTYLPILSGKGFFHEGFSGSDFAFGGRKNVLSLSAFLLIVDSLLSFEASSPVSLDVEFGDAYSVSLA
jgi:hypothetical protein